MSVSLSVLRVVLLVSGNYAMFASYFAGLPTFPLFAFLYFVTFLLFQPNRVLSPLTMLYLYYGAWFIYAPAAASLYSEVLTTNEYRLAFCFSFSVCSLSAFSIFYGERVGLRTRPISFAFPDVRQGTVIFMSGILYIFSSAAVVAIVLGSGGFDVWLRNPGDAFLNRGGTGIYVIASHYSSLILAAITGLLAFRWRRYGFLCFFCFWVILTSPVHGSKLQIMLLLILCFSPWLVTAKFWSARLLAFLGVGILVFVVGMYFRNESVLSSFGMLMSTANYFTALQNLALSIRDFESDLFTTFFLPFNKIWMTLGWLPADSYFDMNHMLTDIYRPDAWAIRATEQWPVETDLFLNFYFFGGLPLIVIFFFLHGWLFGFAKRVGTLGAWFAVVMVTGSMLSHLRGSLYNHVDFYMYPYIFGVAIFMSGWRLSRS